MLLIFHTVFLAKESTVDLLYTKGNTNNNNDNLGGAHHNSKTIVLEIRKGAPFVMFYVLNQHFHHQFIFAVVVSK